MRILFVSPNLDTRPSSGGVQRTVLMLDQLRRMGGVDCFFLPPENPQQAILDEIHAKSGKHFIVPTSQISNASNGVVTAWLNAGRWRWEPFSPANKQVGDLSRYDLVVSRYLSPACILNLFRHPRLLIDVDDYDPDRLRQRISTAGWFKRLTLKRCLRYSEEAHRNLLPRTAHCWVSNPSDCRHPGLSRATVLPNIPYFPHGLPELSPLPSASHPLVFLIVGTLSYSANSDGIDAFLRVAWLSLRAQAPNVELHIVGQGMSVSQRKRWSSFPGVKPIGFVESLAESYARCTATLAPILAGGGTNIKVLESSAYGRPCVVSRVAHRGFEQTLPDGEACLKAERISEMVRPCLRLIRDPDLALRMGTAARHAIEHHYTTDKFNAAVRDGCGITLGKRVL